MVIIDASIVVSCYFKKEKFHKKAKEFLKKLIEQKETILLPEIAFPEIASAIARGTGNPKYAIEFCREIRNLPNFIFVPIDQSISELSVEIASNYFLRGADSIYVAVAYKYSGALATLDKKQKEGASKIVRIIDI
jgi:predicted nucleic acid-binding protein